MEIVEITKQFSEYGVLGIFTMILLLTVVYQERKSVKRDEEKDLLHIKSIDAIINNTLAVNALKDAILMMRGGD